MKTKPSIWLMISLIMFPQIVETIYSPALPHIARGFDVSAVLASQTLSVYFSAFAVGVLVWGIVSDYLGRRTTMLLGLAVYGVAAIGAMFANSFEHLMIMRALSAFGAAVGSVVTQTMLRDSYDGVSLGKVFTYMGIGISLSPVIGMMSGGIIAEQSGYQGVFLALSILALLLFAVCLRTLPETKPNSVERQSIIQLAVTISKDAALWRSAILVACFNIMLFSYYLQGPFIFDNLGYSSDEFGQSGLVLALGTLLGSLVSKKLLGAVRFGIHIDSDALVKLAALLAIVGSTGVYWMQGSLWFLVPMLLIVMAFGIGMPNVLSHALVRYKDQVGSAGALFGMMYYVLIGSGLAVVGVVQNLGMTLLAVSIVAVVLVTTLSFDKAYSLSTK
ncbi:MFS transporter [Vibrio sp. T187]|uniref:multidrug effflux MFS transporter n=1 Tax=Vibrio TaxID=662 RepID=UPI0010C9ACF6|nr:MULTISPECIES: multidrug effflux MFS transporter [Vibrio]MBW3695077.1 MFS transporter [Vibrio sp. T187]